MRPGCASAAACVSSARRAAKRTPASKGRLPAAINAVTCPSEWPGERDRRLGERLHRLPRDERREEHRELRVPCASEDVGGSVGDEVGEWLTERGLGAIDDRPRRVVTPEQSHSRFLRPLSGEDDRDTHK